jgi:monoamine oxidase
MPRSTTLRLLRRALQAARRANLAEAGLPPPQPATLRIGRRGVMLGGALAAAVPVARAAEPRGRADRIAIIGAGLAGLAAAWHLKQAGIVADVYEASDRLGGRVLSLAQDTADRLTGSARAEADRVLGDARAAADQMVSEARYIAETTINEARQQADATLGDAQARSEAQLRQAYEKADLLQSDAERKHSDLMATINQQRTVLEGRLEQLRTFEREYRTRLKTYLESQLEELGQRGSAAPVDSGDGGYPQYQ